MAEKLGLDRSYLADMERDKRNVALMNLEVIALGFELTPSQLLSRVEERISASVPRGGLGCVLPQVAAPALAKA
jgi:transcriptional regulator with XRE-family HTH domain